MASIGFVGSFLIYNLSVLENIEKHMWFIVRCIRPYIYTSSLMKLRAIGLVRTTHTFTHDAHIHLVTVSIMSTFINVLAIHYCFFLWMSV